MDDSVCKICNETVLERSHFWKSHHIKESDFYTTYFPRYDLYDNKKINFISRESYFLTDFNNKTNLKKYLQSSGKKEGLNYLKDWMLRRKNAKNLVYSPSHFELKTLLYPNIKSFHDFFGNNSYENMSKEIGLINRYDYNQKLEFEDKELNFIVDTRENSILDVPNKTIQKLDAGDYTIENSKILIEKKSLNDLCGTVSKGFDRFCRELDRVKKSNKYLIILVEEPFNHISSLAYLPHTKKIKATSTFIFHQIRQILTIYPEICQIVCVDGKTEAVDLIKKIFSLKNKIETVDVQYLIDSKQI